MIVLTINCGSSSIKFQLFQMPEEELLAQGSASKTGNGNTAFSFRSGASKTKEEWKGFCYRQNLDSILKTFVDNPFAVLDSILQIDVIGHRLIHGGEEGGGCVEITETLVETMKKNISLAPLHYPANLEGIKVTRELMPGVLQAGVFDTAFHHTLPPKAFLYGIPLEWYQKHKIRRYGFHGTSHKYASARACTLSGVDFQKHRVVCCHLGNGASVAAIKNGKSVDTSMGMTPVEGLIMGTRSGDIDAGVLIHLQQNFGFSAGELQDLVNNQSGLLGLSGCSADYRIVEQEAEKGDEAAKMALEVYYYRIKKYIGAYAAALGGIDLLVFTGGVGENSSKTRTQVCRELEFLGIRLSEEKNRKAKGTEALIHDNSSRVKIAAIAAREELAIAREVATLAEEKRSGNPHGRRTALFQESQNKKKETPSSKE